jgi:hypothetical protein
MLRMPSCDYGSAYRFEFCGRLDNIQKITTYFVQDFYTGIRISYRCGSSEFLGRLQTDNSTELDFSDEEYLSGLRILLGQRKVLNIEFETNIRAFPCPPNNGSLQVDVLGKSLVSQL